MTSGRFLNNNNTVDKRILIIMTSGKFLNSNNTVVRRILIIMTSGRFPSKTSLTSDYKDFYHDDQR